MTSAWRVGSTLPGDFLHALSPQNDRILRTFLKSLIYLSVRQTEGSSEINGFYRMFRISYGLCEIFRSSVYTAVISLKSQCQVTRILRVPSPPYVARRVMLNNRAVRA